MSHLRNPRARSLTGYSHRSRNFASRICRGYGRFKARFPAKLVRHRELAAAIFLRPADRLSDLIPGFGTNLLVDGKAIRPAMTKDGEAAVGTDLEPFSIFAAA